MMLKKVNFLFGALTLSLLILNGSFVLASGKVSGEVKTREGTYSEKTMFATWMIDRAKVLKAADRGELIEVKLAITIEQPNGTKIPITKVQITNATVDPPHCSPRDLAGNIDTFRECLISQSLNSRYSSGNAAVQFISTNVNVNFGVYSPDKNNYRLVDNLTKPVASGTKYRITPYYLTQTRLGGVTTRSPVAAEGQEFVVTITKKVGGDQGIIKDTKAYYDQFFNQSCSTPVTGKCSTFRDLLIQENRCRNLDTGKNEDGAGFWLYMPDATKQAANLAVDRRPGVCLRLSKVIKYRGAIFNGATDTWNAFYFSAQNTPSEITNLFTNGIFTARLDDFGPDCPQAIRILERGCPSFALSVSSLNGSEPSSLFENNAVKAYITVSQGTYFDMINKLYKADGSGPYSEDHKPQSDNLDNEALKKYQINTAFSGDNPGGSGGGGKTDCENAFKLNSALASYLIGGAVCGTLEFLAIAAIGFANWTLNILIYASGLQ